MITNRSSSARAACVRRAPPDRGGSLPHGFCQHRGDGLHRDRWLGIGRCRLQEDHRPEAGCPSAHRSAFTGCASQLLFVGARPTNDEVDTRRWPRRIYLRRLAVLRPRAGCFCRRHGTAVRRHDAIKVVPPDFHALDGYRVRDSAAGQVEVRRVRGPAEPRRLAPCASRWVRGGALLRQPRLLPDLHSRAQ